MKKLLVLPAAFALALTPAVVAKQQAAHASTPPPAVGWWAGQAVTTCTTGDPTTCPRDTSAYTPAAWSALQAGHGFLNFNLIYHSDFGPAESGVNQRTDALPIIEEANSLGVPINAWITMPVGDGPFDTETNAAEVQQAVKDFYAWETANNLKFGEAILDLEPAAGNLNLVKSAVTTGNPVAVEALAKTGIDPAGQCAAEATYRDTITWAHQHGMRISGSPVMFALDDIENGNTALQDMLDMTAFPPFGYDDLYLQAYRSFGIDLGSGFVAQYYTEMQEHFGASGQVSLGNTGITPYSTDTPVIADVRMLAAMGATTIPIFDFSSSVSSYGVSGISDILAAADNPMSPTELASAEQISPTGAAARALFKTLATFATAATPIVTTLQLNPQQPNAYPNGCGDMTAQPLL